MTSIQKDENNGQKETITKSWLQRLKDESWEAELLVSAIAIFGTFQLFGVINWGTNKFIDFLPPEQYLIGYFIVFMGLLAVSFLVSMFVIHFLLRAYWIGLVGLNSVFPDYSLDDSAYSKIYTERILSILPKLKDTIHKVDDICSVIFSAAFTLLLTYSYLAITSTIYLIIYNFLINYIPKPIALIPIIGLGILLFFQSILSIISNIKQFKQHEKLQILSFKIVKITTLITFGPLYKNLLQITMTFGSNFKKNKGLIRFLALLLLSGVFVASYQINNTNILYLANQEQYFDNTKTYAGYYKNENQEIDFLLTPEIEADVVNKKIVKLFIPIFEHERKLRKNICAFIYEKNDAPTNERNLICYHQYNEVYINDKKYEAKFKKYYHPKTNQFGILTYLNLSQLSEGSNYLRVKKVYSNEDNNIEWNIPFQYITNN
ncbi:hypothetical protein [Aquimarina litoralis]|uniref:hypothetical protein n=1 Tax=Aquimarina litoralis TaxID=584605 RepID=UPI001C592672|nr:hypothetical protein [Aquimarina litoralis]MBW1295079.1 hypothetical protein [Aquimarina litoralis]